MIGKRIRKKEKERENLRYFSVQRKKNFEKVDRMNGTFSERILFRIFHICRKLNLFHLSGIAFLKQEGTSFSFYKRYGLRENFSSSREKVS